MKQKLSKQRVLIVGAGAVGSLTGAFLQRAGHDVTWMVRTGRSTNPGLLRVKRTNGKDRFEIANPRYISVESPIPDHDIVMICVRGDQLDNVLKQSAQRLSLEVPWVVGAATLDEPVSAVRACGVRGAVVTYHVSFGTWFESPGSLRWFPFSTPGSLVSAEGDMASLPMAKAFADCLSKAGLPARSFRTTRHMFRLMGALQVPQTAGWDLSDWSLDRLAADPAIRRLTAKGMYEAVQAVAHDSGLIARVLALFPAGFYYWFLGRLPRMIGTDGKRVWQVHGPKIRGQSLQAIRQLQARSSRGEMFRSLSELADALEAKRSITTATASVRQPTSSLK